MTGKPGVAPIVATDARVRLVIAGVVVVSLGVVVVFGVWSNWDQATVASAFGGAAMAAAAFVASLTVANQSRAAQAQQAESQRHDATERVVTAIRNLVTGEVAEARDGLNEWVITYASRVGTEHSGPPLAASSVVLRRVLLLLRILSWIATLSKDLALTIDEQGAVLVAHANAIVTLLDRAGRSMNQVERGLLSSSEYWVEVERSEKHIESRGAGGRVFPSSPAGVWDTAVVGIQALRKEVPSMLLLPKLMGDGALPTPLAQGGH